MRTIALISCSKAKRTYPCLASELYDTSHLFTLSKAYAQINCDDYFIISAKYGLLKPTDVIKPYDLRLDELMPEEKSKWIKNVVADLSAYEDVENTHFVILAGNVYSSGLKSSLAYYSEPLKGLPLGQRLKWLKDKTSKCLGNDDAINALDLHKVFGELPIFTPKEISSIPFTNGVHVLLSNSEKFYGLKRIVRVGTHTSDDNLIKRLRSHFHSKNQRSSIFRKNVGRALLNIVDDNYIEQWYYDSYELRDRDKEQEIENQISDYLNQEISIVCFEVTDKKTRLLLEDEIIGTLSNDTSFSPPTTWLGNHSPIERIRTSGLWCFHGINSNGLNSDTLSILKNCISGNQVESISSTSIDQFKMTKSFSNNKSTKKRKNPGINDVCSYIEKLKKLEQEKGKVFLDLISGEVHKELGMSNAMPTVCNAMYKLMGEGDVILYQTPSKLSSTIAIRYYLNVKSVEG